MADQPESGEGINLWRQMLTMGRDQVANYNDLRDRLEALRQDHTSDTSNITTSLNSLSADLRDLAMRIQAEERKIAETRDGLARVSAIARDKNTAEISNLRHQVEDLRERVDGMSDVVQVSRRMIVVGSWLQVVMYNGGAALAAVVAARSLGWWPW